MVAETPSRTSSGNEELGKWKEIHVNILNIISSNLSVDRC